MKTVDRFELHQTASLALARILAPWDRPGYVDGSIAS
jgi:hypothetical protein